MLHVNHTAGGEGEYDLFRGDIDGGDEQLHYGDFFDPPPPSAHQKREERVSVFAKSPVSIDLL